MKVVVIGAGLIGISSAYFLAKEGYDVIVIEKNNEPGSETSFANGGQISVCYSEPWASMSNLKKMISWMGKESSPILFKPQFDPNQWNYALQFLYQCLPFNNRKNIKELLGLSLYSRNTLQEMREELGDNLQYNQLTSGILTIYTSEKDFQSGKSAAKFMNQFGCDRIIKTQQETLELLPQLEHAKPTIFGSDFSPEDETGDANLYCKQLAKICLDMGVQFMYGYEALQFYFSDDEHLQGVYVHPTLKDGETNYSKDVFHIEGHAFVLATASLTYKLGIPIGVNPCVYPVKGYSATLDIKDNSLVSDISITDSSHKMVFTKLNNKLRIAGTAEFNGFNYDLNTTRCNALINRAKELFHPNSLDFDNPFFWTGLRPTTPSSVPIIKKTSYENLFLNIGHGTLGFTMAPGSGRILTQTIKKYLNGES